ncbi:MAG: hypothetical protein ACKVX7_13880 [Planctomycetota bacterium]
MARFTPTRRIGAVSVFLLLGCLAALPFANAQSTGDTTKDRAAAAAKYVKELQEFKTEQLTEDGIGIDIKLIPDECMFEVAKRYEDCVRRGQAPGEIEKAIKATLTQHKENQGRPVFRLKLEATSSKDHFFLEKELKSHIGITRKSDMSVKISESKGLTTAKWWFKETASAKDFRMNLGYFRVLEFELRPVGKIDRAQSEPFTVKFKSFLRYREPEKRGSYDRMGINVPSHQVTLADMSELKYPDIEKAFYPAEWKLPEQPQELREILALIEVSK